MLYSGFNILPRSVFWSAYLNGRSDNTDVIWLLEMKQVSIKSLLLLTGIVCAFFAGWASHQISKSYSSGIRLTPDPAIAQFQKTEPDVAYDSKTFRLDLEELVESKQFAAAIRLLDMARVDQQLETDGNCCYYSIAGYAIQNPGTNSSYDRNRDHVMPGTGCCIDSALWVDRAWRFAENYNSYRDDLANSAR